MLCVSALAIEKAAVCKSGRGFSLRTKSGSTLTLDYLTSRIICLNVCYDYDKAVVAILQV
jgi:hypothetical protein